MASSFHIPLHIEKRRALFPTPSTAFIEVDHHVAVHCAGELFNVDESFDEVVAALAAPTVQDLCGTLISSSNEAINSLQFALDHRRMPARDVTTMLAGAVKVLSEAVQATEGR